MQDQHAFSYGQIVEGCEATSTWLQAEKVFDIYKQKHAINLKRQDTNYKKDTKTEDDNRSIS